MTKQSAVLTLCPARHIARLENRSEAIAITRTARRIRDETKDHDLYQLVKMYAGDIPPATVGGKRLTGSELKVMSVAKLESGMREHGATMKTYQIACTTRTGNYIETQTSAASMTVAIEAFIYELAITHLTLMDDVVELDLTEVV